MISVAIAMPPCKQGAADGKSYEGVMVSTVQDELQQISSPFMLQYIDLHVLHSTGNGSPDMVPVVGGQRMQPYSR